MKLILDKKIKANQSLVNIRQTFLWTETIDFKIYKKIKSLLQMIFF